MKIQHMKELIILIIDAEQYHSACSKIFGSYFRVSPQQGVGPGVTISNYPRIQTTPGNLKSISSYPRGQFEIDFKLPPPFSIYPHPETNEESIKYIKFMEINFSKRTTIETRRVRDRGHPPWGKTEIAVDTQVKPM